MSERRFVYVLSYVTVAIFFSAASRGENYHDVGQAIVHGVHRAAAPEPNFRKEVLPLPAGRGRARWPKEFYQQYSRSQDGDLEDATFAVKFNFTPVQKPGGTPDERCIEVKMKIMGDVISGHRYYRDRIAGYRIFNIGEGLPHAGATAGFRLRPVPPPRNEAPSKKDGNKSRAEQEEKHSPVYIAIGKQPGEGEIVVGCFRESGNYSGKIELKAFSDSQEKMEIPWSFTWREGDVTNMRFHLSEVAAYDPESYQGERHPRRRIGKDEKLERMRYRMYGSSTYPDAQNPEPEGFYDGPYRNPDAVRVDI